MNITDDLTTEQVQAIKHWLFKENLRIENEKLKIHDEKRALENEKHDFSREKEAHYNMHDIMKNQLVREKQIFDQKWKILERELKNLAYDRDSLEKAKKQYNNQASLKGTEVLFRGIKSGKDLKKRYKELTKIFHPDNDMGDESIMIEINKEYEKLKFDFQI